MKNIKFITGIWTGIYTYDSEVFNDKSIPFTMSLALEKGEIKGQYYESRDDGGMPVPAEIKGYIEGDTIRLIMQHPYLMYIDETGEYRKDETKPNPKTNYFGDIEGEIVKGTWEMELGYLKQSDGITEKRITGKWKMKKQTFYWA